MGCNCGGGSESVWTPTEGSTGIGLEAITSPIGIEGTPVHLRPGRIGSPATPDWLPAPAGPPAIPTHEQ